MERFLHCLTWLRDYRRETFQSDVLAALIVTIMLIPQSLAYALLAGLPPEVGLYASMLPLVGYAIFGSSNALAVGPVAVVSLMTAAAIGDFAQQCVSRGTGRTALRGKKLHDNRPVFRICGSDRAQKCQGGGEESSGESIHHTPKVPFFFSLPDADAGLQSRF